MREKKKMYEEPTEGTKRDTQSSSREEHEWTDFFFFNTETPENRERNQKITGKKKKTDIKRLFPTDTCSFSATINWPYLGNLTEIWRNKNMTNYRDTGRRAADSKLFIKRRGEEENEIPPVIQKNKNRKKKKEKQEMITMNRSVPGRYDYFVRTA